MGYGSIAPFLYNDLPEKANSEALGNRQWVKFFLACRLWPNASGPLFPIHQSGQKRRMIGAKARRYQAKGFKVHRWRIRMKAATVK